MIYVAQSLAQKLCSTLQSLTTENLQQEDNQPQQWLCTHKVGNAHAIAMLKKAGLLNELFPQ